MAVDEARHGQPTGAVDRLIAVEPQADVGDAIAFQDDIGSVDPAGGDVEDRTTVQQQPHSSLRAVRV
ncbi:hypothetical protein [Kribbella sp. NPDC048915]|uniref:hypothetical protein n=1 Tax=Kribbella sp. NPDC048915 TaxID=3155148 RepID=UPI0033C61CAB